MMDKIKPVREVMVVGVGLCPDNLSLVSECNQFLFRAL